MAGSNLLVVLKVAGSRVEGSKVEGSEVVESSLMLLW